MSAKKLERIKNAAEAAFFMGQRKVNLSFN